MEHIYRRYTEHIGKEDVTRREMLRERGGETEGERRSVESSDSSYSSPAQLPVINNWVVVN